MELHEKLEKIKNLSENEFRKEVLIPLFIAMGYQNVIEYHGKNERGKDIIFHETDNVGEKIYTAVVVKKERIHGTIGKAGSVADVVFIQATQALNEPYIDVYSMDSLKIDKCWVLTSNEIVPSSFEAIFNSMKQYGLDRFLRFYNGNWVVQKINFHMPTFWGDEGSEQIIKAQRAEIVDLYNKKQKAVEVIYRLGRDYETPTHVVEFSSTAVQTAPSGTTLASTLYSGVSGEISNYSERKISRSEILDEFFREGIIEETIRCQRCGTVNNIDKNSIVVICKNCDSQIF